MDNNTDKVFSKNLFSNFSSSISFDKRIYKEDIKLSIAYSKALKKIDILTSEEQKKIEEGLTLIHKEIESGKFKWRDDLEDIHMNIESRLHDLVGGIAGKIHTGKSRNDQVATSLRMYLKTRIDYIHKLIRNLEIEVVNKAELNFGIIMPSYTHLQKAQPVLLSHHLMAYFEMLERDISRFYECKNRMDQIILGSGAVAGSFYDIDREFLAKELDFSRVNKNSIDGVSDRDFILDLANCITTSMMHLTRLSEELILWSSEEFNYINLPDNVVTTSSMMPQKRNPDYPELIRGKFGRTLGNLVSIITMLKALPLSYNRDMQEDKEPIFDSIDTYISSMEVMIEIIKGSNFNKKVMMDSASGNILATDLADILTMKGVPFRESHITISKLTNELHKEGKSISDLSKSELSKALGEDIDIDNKKSINSRNIVAGTSENRVKEEIKTAKKILNI
ncbi:MAG: argininosuccinate lyase [Chloroflexi bacterium]|nr:argininosuccinate lyase [Chloroflexota bacterium]|tara:strand:+ start:11015 stop:12364 length:1350 start_codon:yes stop_codon:yes gene_type:complete